VDTLNRSAIVVKPKRPFLEWLHAADPTSRELSLPDLAREPTICLIPECVHCANHATGSRPR